jgi:transposase
MLIFYADEASISLTPSVSRTFAPIGQTPKIAVNTGINQRLYTISAINESGQLEYQVQNEPYDGKSIVNFLKHLRSKVNKKILVIWDGASIHFAKVVQDYLATLPEKAIFLVKQPPYSPEINADEQVWAYLKGYLMKNDCVRDIKELHKKLCEHLSEMQKNKQLIASFFRHPDLGYYQLSS